jgi:hypothetical protein
MAFLCLTLIFKVVVPVGYMPDFDAVRQGVYKIKICSGMDHHAQSDEQHTNSQNTNHKIDKSGDGYCPFAGMHASALTIAGIFLAALLFLWQQLRFTDRMGVIQPVSVSSAWPQAPPFYLA